MMMTGVVYGVPAGCW